MPDETLHQAMLDRVDAELPDDHQERLLRVVIGICAKVATEQLAEQPTPNADSIAQAEANARRKWKDTGDPVWAYAEAALAWARGSTNVEPGIATVLGKEAAR